MTVLATTATALPPGTGSVALVAVGAAVLYVIECLIWPHERCPRCKGGGVHIAPDGDHWRDCRTCTGTGRRHRLGRRLWDTFRRNRH
jgi:hypothetical protein